MIESDQQQIALSDGTRVGALWRSPERPLAAIVLAHGAGAPMTHPFMERVAEELSRRDIATLRFNFPYSDQGRKRPDTPKRLRATWHAAWAFARQRWPTLPWFAGGKSMGGRIAALCAADNELDACRGLVFLGFPLHAAGRPNVARGELLMPVQLPMLFLQGDRDKLAELALMTPLCHRLAPRATLQLIKGGDHSFAVLKRSGRTSEDVFDELSSGIREWIAARR